MKKIFLLMCSFAAFLLLSACRNTPHYPSVPAGSVVLALGDSLTYGYGTTPEYAYPNQLQAATQWQVINAGINGDTSAQALARLPALLKQYQPRLLIISIGGNDFLRRIPEQETRQNITAMLQLAREENAEVLLIGIPQLNAASVMGLPKDHSLYQEIAAKNRVQLYSNGWGEILKDKTLHSDAVHPNTAGYTRFTQALVKYLKTSGRLR